MTKLIHKLTTKPSKETDYKKDTSFPFATLPKEKPSLQFSNKAIANYLPTFDNARHIKIPFKVPLKSHLKGLTLRMSYATKSKYFLLQFWFKGRNNPFPLGMYGPGFGVKEVSVKLFDIYEKHTNDKGIWIRDPKLTEVEEETKITKSQFSSKIGRAHV